MSSVVTTHRTPFRRLLATSVESEFAVLVFTLVTGPRRSLSLKLSGRRVYEPPIRARLGTTAH